MIEFLTFLGSLLLTVLIEWAMVLVMTKDKTIAKHSVLINAVTNPAMNFMLVLWESMAIVQSVAYYYILMVILEGFVVYFEARLYMRMHAFDEKNAFKTSIILNATTFVVGIIFGLIVR